MMPISRHLPGRRRGWATWLLRAFILGSLLFLAQPSHAVTEIEEAHQVLNQVANEVTLIEKLEKEFAHWKASGGNPANWETSPSGIELARRQRVLANLKERLSQLGIDKLIPEPATKPPPGQKWVRALKRGVWVWTLIGIIRSDNVAAEILDVSIGMGCAQLGAGIGTLCFGPLGGVVGGVAAGVVAPHATDLIPGSGGRDPDVKPAPAPPPPPSPVEAAPQKVAPAPSTMTVTVGAFSSTVDLATGKVTSSAGTPNGSEVRIGGLGNITSVDVAVSADNPLPRGWSILAATCCSVVTQICKSEAGEAACNGKFNVPNEWPGVNIVGSINKADQEGRPIGSNAAGIILWKKAF